jgi:hypothetical protein
MPADCITLLLTAVMARARLALGGGDFEITKGFCWRCKAVVD